MRNLTHNSTLLTHNLVMNYLSHPPISSDELKALGFTPGPAFGIALETANNQIGHSRDTVLFQLEKVRERPESFVDNPIYGRLATALLNEAQLPRNRPAALAAEVPPYAVYGPEHIESGARRQMDLAMRLPITVGGALMPDAHQGYGLPIGGVLATDNAVIPYGVGVDIGCRMALSIYDIPEAYFDDHQSRFKRALIAQTRFGAGKGFTAGDRADHGVLTNPLFGTSPLLSKLKDKAWEQLGSSGGGNHFVEFGILALHHGDSGLGIAPGRYVALLSHSGSRGLGATVASHYTKVAKQQSLLPREAQNLAYLDLSTEAGQAYWLAMTLAGDYASANHEVIHRKLTQALGAEVLATVENHHNFAWKESWNGQEVIVHRKGATPAGVGVLGIIPGSMTAPGFLVRGRGVPDAIQSAAHGAGRQMSRNQAAKTISREDMKDSLARNGVTLIGAGLDEAPMAYKDIHTVMAAQTDLIEVIATFSPRIVRMADDGSRED